ncbi:hypothetical protein GGR92_004492 [Spirosoma lacussanchae]|uniref:pPIWI-RE three-gene island domain-containing protein n=1 Tax=Spirosoma sordidisoli TaxID=2502893 RepID=A0A4Q2UBY2_9BACT|nr:MULTISPECIES: hypothetical protein [Spirosoma]RYC66294.1 hypothetical protein EQG79_30465 [Spirosoma sordidisoli]
MNALLTTAPVARPVLASQLRWQEPLATRLRFRHALPGMVANRLLNIELGLFLMAELLPLAPPESLPDLLNGQGAAFRQRPIWSPRQHRMLSQARMLLAPYQNRNVWYNALIKYAGLRSDLRAFTLKGNLNAQVGSTILRERVTLFRQALG